MENKTFEVNVRYTIEGVLKVSAKSEQEAHDMTDKECILVQAIVSNPVGSQWDHKTRKTVWGVKEVKRKKI